METDKVRKYSVLDSYRVDSRLFFKKSTSFGKTAKDVREMMVSFGKMPKDVRKVVISFGKMPKVVWVWRGK